MKILYISLGIISVLILIVLALYLIMGHCIYHSIFARNSKMKKKSENLLKKNIIDIMKAKDYFKDNFEKLNINSEDGVNLVGYYKNNNSNKLVILVHGFGGCHLYMLQYVDFFIQLGYDVLSIDSRGHGDSEGKYLTMGKIEKNDLRLWIENMLVKKQDYKIILFGLDFSASAICLLLGEKLPNNVVLAIENGGFDNANKFLRFTFSKYKLKRLFTYKLLLNFAKKTRNLDLKRIDVVDAIKKSKIPILFIHEQRDEFVPVEMVYKLSEVVSQGRKEVYIIDNPENDNLYTVNNSYKRIIKSFLDKYHM